MLINGDMNFARFSNLLNDVEYCAVPLQQLSLLLGPCLLIAMHPGYLHTSDVNSTFYLEV